MWTRFSGVEASESPNPSAIPPEAYLVPVAYFDRLLKQLEDLQDAQLVRQRAYGPFIEISPDTL